MNRKQYARIFAQQHAIYERKIYPVFLNKLKRDIAPVLRMLEDNPTNSQVQALINSINILIPVTGWVKVYQTAYYDIGITAARREYYFQRNEETKGLLDILVDGWKKYFTEYAANYAYRFQNELTETTRQKVRQALEAAYELGLSGNKLVTQVKKALNASTRDRAKVISRTETTTIANVSKELGAVTYFQEQRIEGFSQWITRLDGRERASHRSVNDVIKPIGGKFIVGGHECERPGDLVLPGKERIQCRCVKIFMSRRRAERLGYKD